MAPIVNMRTVAAAVFSILAIILGNIYTINNADKNTRAVVFRMQFVCVAQIVTFIGAKYIWENVNSVIGEQTPTATMRTDRVPVTVCFGFFFRRAIRVIALTFLVLSQLSNLAAKMCAGDEPSFLGIACFVALGMLVQLTVCTFFMNRVLSVWSFMKRRQSSAALSKQRKASFVMMTSLIYVMIFTVYGMHFASQPPLVKHVEIPIKKLPLSMDGTTMVLVADVHLGATVGKYKLSRIVNMVNELNPDIVTLVGDMIDAPVSRLAGAADPIKNLKARIGTFFVTGNHEYYSGGVEDWFDYWRARGVIVLHNQHVKVNFDGQSDFFYLVGVDDLEARRIYYNDHGMDLPRAMAGCDEDHAVVLLAHQPRAAKIAMDSNYTIQLVLSGHTHGGQMFPVILGVYLFNPFFAGLYKYGSGHVYVSQGTVYWGVPMRVGTQHEITVITLKAAQ